nr:MAG: major capsid protein [Microvirus sp.]
MNPIGWTEVLPGDSIQHSTSALIRVSPLLTPVMHKMDIRIHHWFVPFRLIWEDWEDFITGGPDGMDASVAPYITTPATPGFPVGSLADLLGVTPGDVTTPGAVSMRVSALPFRAYQLIWNEWYRDQDLENPTGISLASGSDTSTSTFLKRVCWQKDYFTTARPWAQKGPTVSIPMEGSADVVSNNSSIDIKDASTQTNRQLRMLTTGGMAYNGSAVGANDNTFFGNNTGLEADLGSITDPATINQLRIAFALQRYEEARARYGSRYVEYLRYIGVRSSDARLQRPEYLGGGKNVVQFSEVLQTSPNADGGTSEDEGVGTMRGHGIAAMRSNRYRRFFEEHGIVMTMMSAVPQAIYQDGMSRSWFRTTKTDYFQKELQYVGQQEVYRREYMGNHPQPAGIAGYQDRYSEYRQGFGRVSGDFRTTLKEWHMARIFDPLNPPDEIDSAFVECVPTDRVYAVPTEDVLWVKANHSIQARRIVAPAGSSFVL